MLTTLLILSFAVSAVSLTITRSSFFKGLREFVMERNVTMGKLLHCPYCISHWGAFAAVLAAPLAVTGTWWVDFIIGAFAVVGVSALLTGLTMHALHIHEEVRARLEDELEDLRNGGA